MEGRPGHGDEPEEEYYSKRLAALNGLNGTGKHRTPLQRPPGMTRVEQAPAAPRVARPKRETPRKFGRGLLIGIGVLLVCTVAACIFGYSLGSNFLTSLGASSGAATTATDFLQSVAKQDYESAYKDLGGAITMQLTLEAFEQNAQHDDVCFGTIKSYSEIAGSAVVQGNTQSYTYTIIRDKSSAAYQLRLMLQQDLEASSVWKVTGYGGDLGPSQACK